MKLSIFLCFYFLFAYSFENWLFLLFLGKVFVFSYEEKNKYFPSFDICHLKLYLLPQSIKVFMYSNCQLSKRTWRNPVICLKKLVGEGFSLSYLKMKFLKLNRWASSVFVFIYLFYLVFLGPHLRHRDVPRLGVQSELQLLAYTTPHGNSGSLTQWARPGIEPRSSWMLVGFINCWAMSGTPVVFLKQRKHSPFLKKIIVCSKF